MPLSPSDLSAGLLAGERKLAFILPPMPSEGAKAFIARWAAASPSERANSQPFLCELCHILGVATPEPTRETGYAFEYDVIEHHPDGSTTKGRIDLYKRGCFVLESKQFQPAKAAASQLALAAQEAGVIERTKSSQPVRGSEAWDDAMIRARGQAERHVRALPRSEPNPPFLLVAGCDFESGAERTGAKPTGRRYLTRGRANLWSDPVLMTFKREQSPRTRCSHWRLSPGASATGPPGPASAGDGSRFLRRQGGRAGNQDRRLGHGFEETTDFDLVGHHFPQSYRDGPLKKPSKVHQQRRRCDRRRTTATLDPAGAPWHGGFGSHGPNLRVKAALAKWVGRDSLSLAFRPDLGHLRGDRDVNEQPELVLDLEKLPGLDRREGLLDLARGISPANPAWPAGS